MRRAAAFVACDIAAGLQGPFDLIVSNPPYVVHGELAALPPEVRDYDPALALDGGADGLDSYRAIAGEARRLLAPGGRLIVELGAGQEPAVRNLFTKAGLKAGAGAPGFGRNCACASAQLRAINHACIPSYERPHCPSAQNAGLVFG